MIYKQEEFTPVNDYMLIQPIKANELIQELQVPDPDKNKLKKIDDIQETKTVKNKIKSTYRVGQIISMTPKEGVPYGVRSWITYNEFQAKRLDLLTKKESDDKCPKLIKHWDVIAVVKNDKLN